MDIGMRPSWRDQFGLLIVLAALPVVTGWMLINPPAGLPPAILAGSGAVMIVIAGTVLLYRHFVWRFHIDEATIESCYGIISRDVHSIRVRDLRNINVRQSILQRILGIGDVEFSSAGGAGIEVTFFGVKAPLTLKEEVLALEAAPSDASS